MLTAVHVHSRVRTTAPSPARTEAASAGTRRPPSPGSHRGNTSPQVETRPTAVNASSSETADSPTTYAASGMPGSPDAVVLATRSPRAMGAWKVHTAIRHALDGSTVNGMARAAIRAQRGTPAAGACAAAQAARSRGAGGASVIELICCSSRPGPVPGPRAFHDGQPARLAHHRHEGMCSLARGKGRCPHVPLDRFTHDRHLRGQ
jgi:hypothetical protein